MKIIKSCQIIFADDKIEKEFNDLDDNQKNNGPLHHKWCSL
ncbi:MAG: hypothetical protein WC781_00405 [Candidatus Pacearchaeota archaeon]|jgi:hypothetical protein